LEEAAGELMDEEAVETKVGEQEDDDWDVEVEELREISAKEAGGFRTESGMYEVGGVWVGEKLDPEGD
jgi:hypothetical protein